MLLSYRTRPYQFYFARWWVCCSSLEYSCSWNNHISTKQAPKEHRTMVVFSPYMHYTCTLHAPYKAPYMHNTCTVQACTAISKNILSRQLLYNCTFVKLINLQLVLSTVHVRCMQVAYKMHVRCILKILYSYKILEWQGCKNVSRNIFIWSHHPFTRSSHVVALVSEPLTC